VGGCYLWDLKRLQTDFSFKTKENQGGDISNEFEQKWSTF
jgi:hypothetical protein